MLKNEFWHRFIREGQLDQRHIRGCIAESWKRCRNKGVDPYKGMGQVILTHDELRNRQVDHKTLLTAFQSLLDQLEPLYSASNVIFILADEEGYILKTGGNSEGMEKAKTIRFVEGVSWTEDTVGTNAIGTALKIEEAITIRRTEHYAIASQSWVCSAVPIRNPKGQIIGIFNASFGEEDRNVSVLIPMIKLMACHIELYLEKQIALDSLELLSKINSKFTANQHPYQVLCDQSDIIKWVSPPMRKEANKYINQSINYLQKSSYIVESKKKVYSSDHEGVIGYEMTLSLQENGTSSKTQTHPDHFHFDGVKGTSHSFKKVLMLAHQAAKEDVTVHISGETGTGKEMMAHAIHENSHRADRPFIAINCGVIPKDLLSSELFGYVGGAYTGAKRNGHKGYFEQANGGTLFLDEIGDISYEVQTALLRVIQEKEIIPIGSTKPIPINIRIITATHHHLKTLVKQGQWREDLYYRLYVFPINLPALRDRKEDIQAFIDDFSKKGGWNAAIFSKSILAQFMDYTWPGNIRELMNVLERLKVTYGDHLPSDLNLEDYFFSKEGEIKSEQGRIHSSADSPKAFRDQLEKDRIIEALKQVNGKVREAAVILDMPKSTLYRKLRKYDL
ncbi:sigma-54-dependent Fis family transcriptional regulator [Terrilactibacillus laevilacticus]|uniref:Sigma-54-dependent Fis family transcriptional regulator n=1 Tax=Terrilactibacillus laevilacticus TaxID=1380157 RepID=A0ABW5PS40_9BACI|nr:sigma-54-dependent Fis family transcriptional regulator [Terrilactibacillus laevilacticus]